MTTKFETGATTHAVNDLILFTDNTRELAELRDSIYKDQIAGVKPDFSLERKFLKLLEASIKQYVKELPEDNTHIKGLNYDWQQRAEFCRIYAEDFSNWKQEHGIQ